MLWFRKPERQIAVKYKARRPEFEEACQHVNTATFEHRLPWRQHLDENGKRPTTQWGWDAEVDLPSGRFQVWLRNSGYQTDHTLGFVRVGGDDPGVLVQVELRKDFGKALYDEVRRQVYGPMWAKNDADRAAAVEEAKTL